MMASHSVHSQASVQMRLPANAPPSYGIEQPSQLVGLQTPLGTTHARMPVSVSHSPDWVPRLHGPHGVSSGWLQLNWKYMQPDHVQSFMHCCWPEPISLEQSMRSSGRHAAIGSIQARTPVIGSQSPERVPQFPQGVVVGSLQLSAVS